MDSPDNTVCVLDTPEEKSNCLLAVPKKGRIYERCMKLLAGAGLDHHRPTRLDVAHCTTLPLTIVFLPASDIASYVGEGNVDIGITGLDCVEECGVDVEKVLELGFGDCRLCLQAPEAATEIKTAEDVAGKRIVTSFPHIARQYFDKIDKIKNTETKIRYVSGSVEAACGLGLADAVVDLVETGTTMKAAGLRIVDTIINTEAYLIASKTSRHPEMVEIIKKRITGYMTATSYMMISYNVSRDVLPKCLQITPGKRSASVAPLESGDAVAVSALVITKKSSQIMDELEAVGATDILLFGISNSRM